MTVRGLRLWLLEPVDGQSGRHLQVKVIGVKLTVAARSVDLANVYDGVVADVDASRTIVLDDFVVGILSTTTYDSDGAGPEGRDSVYGVCQRKASSFYV